MPNNNYVPVSRKYHSVRFFQIAQMELKLKLPNGDINVENKLGQDMNKKLYSLENT